MGLADGQAQATVAPPKKSKLQLDMETVARCGAGLPTPSQDQLKDDLAHLRQYRNAKLTHLKYGGKYRLIDFHYRESDMTVEFTYATDDSEKLAFSRPLPELFDGRFRIVLYREGD